MTVDGTLAELCRIEEVLAAFAETAPRAVAGMGGVEALVSRSQMTAVGPVLSLTVGKWSALAREATTLGTRTLTPATQVSKS